MQLAGGRPRGILGLAGAEGSAASAILLAAATASPSRTSGVVVQHSERGRFEHLLHVARAAVGESLPDRMWDRGSCLTLSQAGHAQSRQGSAQQAGSIQRKGLLAT